MKKNNKKGFTIVELVIVIAVIAILAAVLIPTFTSVTENAKKSAALQEARNAYTAITIHDIDAEQDAVENNEVGENYLIKVDGYFFEVVNGELSTTPVTVDITTGFEELPESLDIADLPDGVVIYREGKEEVETA